LREITSQHEAERREVERVASEERRRAEEKR